MMQSGQIGQFPYFERQGAFSRDCGLHAVNNVLGNKYYTKDSFNGICEALDPKKGMMNQHRHFFGGDFDANILIIALQNAGCTVDWHDARQPVNLRRMEQQGDLVGMIINVPTKQNFLSKMLLLSGRHWTVLKKNLNNYYYLMDSQEDRPHLLGTILQAEGWVSDMNSPGTEILVVYRKKKEQ